MKYLMILVLLLIAVSAVFPQDLRLLDSVLNQVGLTPDDVRFDQDEMATWGGDRWRLSYFSMFHRNPFKLPKYGQMNLEASAADCGNIVSLIGNAGRKIDCPIRRSLIGDALEPYTKRLDSLPGSSFTGNRKALSGDHLAKLRRRIDVIIALVDDPEFNLRKAFAAVQLDKVRRQVFDYFVADSQKYNDLVEELAESIDLNRMVAGTEDLAEALRRASDSLEYCAFPDSAITISTERGLIVLGTKSNDDYK